MDHGKAEDTSIQHLMMFVGDILTATPKGKAVKDEMTDGMIAKSQNWMIAAQVLGTFLQNMRDIVCDGQAIKSMTGELHLSPNDLNMLISTSVATKFGISSLVCRALAALLVMVVNKAAYATFCQMTDAQVIERILHRVSFG